MGPQHLNTLGALHSSRGLPSNRRRLPSNRCRLSTNGCWFPSNRHWLPSNRRRLSCHRSMNAADASDVLFFFGPLKTALVNSAANHWRPPIVA